MELRINRVWINRAQLVLPILYLQEELNRHLSKPLLSHSLWWVLNDIFHRISARCHSTKIWRGLGGKVPVHWSGRWRKGSVGKSGPLYSGFQCIMDNGHMGPLTTAVDRMTDRLTWTTIAQDKSLFPAGTIFWVFYGMISCIWSTWFCQRCDEEHMLLHGPRPPLPIFDSSTATKLTLQTIAIHYGQG